MKLVHLPDNTILLDDVHVAADHRSRARGLIGHATLSAGEGLVIEPCRWIHTWRMSFPIDALYLDRDWRVVATTHGIPPGRIDRPVFAARRVVEMQAGAIARLGLAPGDRLALQP